MKFSSLWLPLMLLIASASAQDFSGDWQATALEGGKPVRYVMHIKKLNQELSATVDAPASFSFDNTVDAISVSNSRVEIRNGQVTYEGSLAADSQSITGTWALGGDQQNVTWKRITKPTGDRLESVARHLQSLIFLPAEQWKVHPGDIPHGESTDLDDSSWQSVGPNSFAPHDAVWYRRWVEIPKTLNGYDVSSAKA